MVSSFLQMLKMIDIHNEGFFDDKFGWTPWSPCSREKLTLNTPSSLSMHYLLISTQSRLRTSSLSARVSHTTSLVAIRAQSVVDKDNFGLRPCDSWYLNAAWSANHWKVNGGLSNRGEKETTYKNIYHLKKLFFFHCMTPCLWFLMWPYYKRSNFVQCSNDYDFKHFPIQILTWEELCITANPH